jgi:hypothetical protein
MIQRLSNDFTNEVSDFYFSITPAMSYPTPSAILDSNCSAKLYGIGVEYQPTRDLK